MVMLPNPKRLGRADIFQIARPQELCPHDAHQGGPAEQDHKDHKQPETAPQYRKHDDDDVKLRDRAPDFDHPLEHQIQPASEKALNRARSNANQRCSTSHHQREQDGQAETVDNPCQDIPLGVIRAQQVLSVRWQRGRTWPVDGGVVAVGNDWPNRPALVKPVTRICTSLYLFQDAFRIIKTVLHPARGDEALNLRVAVGGLGLEVSTKGGFRVKS